MKVKVTESIQENGKRSRGISRWFAIDLSSFAFVIYRDIIMRCLSLHHCRYLCEISVASISLSAFIILA